jgi:hypothetical protein
MPMTEPDPKSAEEELISYLKPEDEEYLEHYGWKHVKPEPPKLVVPPKPVLTVPRPEQRATTGQEHIDQLVNALRTPNEVRAYNELESSRKAEQVDATGFGSRVRNTLPGMMLHDPERGPEYWQRLARDTDDLTERRCYLQKARALQNDIITERSRVRTVTEQMGRDHASGLIAGLTTSLSPSQPSEVVPFSSRTQIHRGAREIVQSSQELIRDARGFQRDFDRLRQTLAETHRRTLERAQFWRRMRSFIGVNTLVSVALMFLAYSFWQQNYDQDTQQQAARQSQMCAMYATTLGAYNPSTRTGQDLLNYNTSFAQISVAYRELRCQ